MSINGLIKDLEMKHIAMFLSVILLLGMVSGVSLDTFKGEVVQAIISGESISSRWVGYSGELDGFQDETTQPVRTLATGSQKSGGVNNMNLDGQRDGKHYFVASPYNVSNFNSSKVRNISLSELESNGIFDEEDFPIFYPSGLSYGAMSDTPEETFTEEANITVLSKSYEGAVTNLREDVPFYVLGYQHNGEKIPIFVSKMKKYDACYDGSSCDFQMMLPNLQGGEYFLYQVSSVNPILVRTFVDGEISTSFEYPGRPYNLTLTTRAPFKNNKLVDRDLRIIERSGNNLFTPAISSDYSSEARIETSTKNGSKSLLYSPTGYNSPNNYNISVQAMSKGEIAGEEFMTVENNNIEFTDKGPDEKGFSFVSRNYKKGVNRLRPIAKCMFDNVNNFGRVYNLPISSSGQSYEVVRGVPYVVEISDPDASRYRLEEGSSHLAMAPAKYEELGETYHLGSGGTYSSESEVVFTPTVPANKDEQLDVELMNEEGDIIYSTNLTVKESTCGDVSDGLAESAPNLNDFKKRINSIRPVLNSLFVAGS